MMTRGVARHAAAGLLPAPLDLTIFRQMVDMSSEAFYLIDAEGRYLYVNERSVTMGGYTREEYLRMNAWDTAPDFPQERVREFGGSLAPGKSIPRFETRSRRKDGSIFPVEFSVARIEVNGKLYFFGVVRDISERKHLEAVQKSFAQRLLETLEAERERVARELRDDVGKSVATVGVLLDALENRPGGVPEEARPLLAATHHAIKQITDSIARIVRDHHPAELLSLGLEGALRSHAREFAHRHKLRLDLAALPVTGMLSAEQELHVYRIAQEALANVAHHAHARRVMVRMARQRRRLVVRVRDDGVGFDPERPARGGLGLVTMRERAGLLGAELEVISTRGRGTKIRLTVPLGNL